MESVSVNLNEFNLLATNVGATAGPGSSAARDWGALGRGRARTGPAADLSYRCRGCCFGGGR